GTPETRALPASVVTVAVTPEDAERVGLAMENGTFRLVLRRPDDNTVSPKTFTTLEQVLTPSRGTPEQVGEGGVGEPLEKGFEEPPQDGKWEPIPAPQRRVHVVTIREGDKVRTESYELEDESDEPPAGRQPGQGGAGGQNAGPATLDSRV